MEELEKQTQTEITTEIEQETKPELKLDDFPNFQDLVKSEQEIKSERKLQGLTSAEPNQTLEDRPFARKEDERKKFVKKRVKLVTGVYIAVATLMLAFVGACSNEDSMPEVGSGITERTLTFTAAMPDKDGPSTRVSANEEDNFMLANVMEDYISDYSKKLWMVTARTK